MERKYISIVGVGLMGGSLAIRLHEKKISSGIAGVEKDKDHAQSAVELELVDRVCDLETAINESDVIILCIPVDEILRTLPGILDRVNSHQVVIDLGSTKQQILELVKDHPRRGRFVATHPMWGTEYSGPRAATGGAFRDKAVIICDSNLSNPDALEWTRTMYRKIGMHVIEMDGVSHDLHVAYISHISHITSFALANTVLEKEKQENTIFELASSGFESTVRLAKSHAAMWLPIFMQNRENVLDVLNEHISQLKKFRSSLENENWASLRELIDHANQIRRIIK